MPKLNTTMKKDKINQIFKDVFNLFLIEIKKRTMMAERDLLIV